MTNGTFRSRYLALVASVAFFASSLPPGDWYASLSKPSWTPPSWLFGRA